MSGIGFQLIQKQTQKLVMTQDLRQSIELLTLSTLELAEKIQSELQENPILEDISNTETNKLPETYNRNDILVLEKLQFQKNSDISWQDSYSLEGPRVPSSDASDKFHKYIESSPQSESLSEHLLSQFRLLPIKKWEYRIAEIVVSLLDDKGFLSVDLEDIAKDFGYKVSSVQKVIQKIQELDPIGIGSRNLTETLLVQSKILFPKDSILHELIENHLTNLEKFDFKKIAKSLNLSEEECQEKARLIKKLEPFPASLYAGRKVNYVIPDVVIRNIDGKFDVGINDEWLPKLTLNDEYKDIHLKTKDSLAKEYIHTKMNSALWLIRSINQRRQTLYRVVSCIIDFQEDFFKNGVSFIRPLTLKEVAEKLNLHESTISRITTNKYIQTNWGIFELKWFFSSGLKSTEGGKESSKKIHDMIRNLVKSEDGENPLSDQEIVEIMGKKGIEIARRTVAKYRKILKILPSSQRKRMNSFN